MSISKDIIKFSINFNIKSALRLINKKKRKIIFFCDENGKLLSSLNDGDIRRGLLNNFSFSDKAYDVSNKNPIFILEKNINNLSLKSFRTKYKDYYIPVLDSKNKIIKILEPLNYTFEDNSTNILILAGGFGRRLHPLTKEKPKPLLTIGKNVTILGKVIDSLFIKGLQNIYVSSYYKKELISDFLKNNYPIVNLIKEKKELGTAGPLINFYKIKNDNNSTILLLNGDVLTDLDYNDLIKYHDKNKADLTIVTKINKVQLDYGEIFLKKNRIHNIIEKPLKEFVINTGIYVINPIILKNFIKIQNLNMDIFIKSLLSKKYKVLSYNHQGYYIDIGTKSNLEKTRYVFSY